MILNHQMMGSSPSGVAVAVVQLAEHQIVALDVVGSSPIGHLAIVI